ncbi:hypothetical protein N0V90_000193 [Kalmusia sp. IMI 367209]|nr:hypothetical protein N0V90_000193 [Kalmusia sp. IMI 367209]
MATHPLPALPFEPNIDYKRVEEWDEQKVGWSDHAHVQKGSEVELALFEDTSGIYTYHLRRDTTLIDDSEALQPGPSHCERHDAHSYSPSMTHLQYHGENSHRTATLAVCDEQDDVSWATVRSMSPAEALRASCDTVCDYDPDTSRIKQQAHSHFDANGNTSRKALKDAGAHTILYNPLLTPPPHQTSREAISHRTFHIRDNFSEPERFAPCGPRIPPWGSTDNLDRKRRSRTGLRSLEDTLEDRFDEEHKKRVMERQRLDEEMRSGKRKTEVDELRDLVLELYPDMNLRRDDEKKRCGCSCVVM